MGQCRPIPAPECTEYLLLVEVIDDFEEIVLAVHRTGVGHDELVEERVSADTGPKRTN